MARDHRGEVIFLRGIRHHLCRPTQAEVDALLWAMKLVIQEQWSVVIFEGDAKICIDALSNSKLIPDWYSTATISNIRCLSSHFTAVKFSWVRRLGNLAAHEIAKFALNSNLDFCFNNGNLPPSLEAICMGDSSVCSFSV